MTTETNDDILQALAWLACLELRETPPTPHDWALQVCAGDILSNAADDFELAHKGIT